MSTLELLTLCSWTYPSLGWQYRQLVQCYGKMASYAPFHLALNKYSVLAKL